MKKILSLILACILACSCVSIAFAKEIIMPDGIDPELMSSEYNDAVFKSDAIIYGLTPCKGDVRIVVFNLRRPNKSYLVSKTELNNLFFKNISPNIPSNNVLTENDSVKRYLESSALGKITITGDVFNYTTKTNNSYSLYEITHEIIQAADNKEFGSSFSWASYDGDSDRKVDCVAFICSESDIVVDESVVDYAGFAHPSIGAFLDLDNDNLIDFGFASGFALTKFSKNDIVSSAVHEICHTMGMPDIYDADTCKLNPVNVNGSRYCTVMDNYYITMDDIPSPFKYCYAWSTNHYFTVPDNYTESEKVQTFNLRPYSKTNEVIVIPKDGNMNSEQFLMIEYLDGSVNDHRTGIRIWRTNISQKTANEGRKWAVYGNVINFIEGIDRGEKGNPDPITRELFKAGDVFTLDTNPSTRFAKGLRYNANNKLEAVYEDGGITKIEIVSTTAEKAVVKVTWTNPESQDSYTTPNMTFMNFFNKILELFRNFIKLITLKYGKN